MNKPDPVKTASDSTSAKPPVSAAGDLTQSGSALDQESPPTAAEPALQQALAEIAMLKDQFLRAKADNENLRRRAEMDVANARRFAIENFVRELVRVKDSLDGASELEIDQHDSGALETMREGLGLTARQLDSVFDRFAIVTVAPAPGDRFDPTFHQAMTTQESTDIKPDHVVNLIQKGYVLHERLLRPAMVIVARAPASTDSSRDPA